MVDQDHKVPLDYKGSMANLVQQDQLAGRVVPDNLVLQAPRVSKDLMDNPDRPDNKVKSFSHQNNLFP